MAQMTIVLRRDPASGKQNIIVKLDSDPDALPIEHEQLHKKLVEKLVGKVVEKEDLGEIIIERGSTARDLGPKLNRSAGDIVRFLLLQGEMVMATQSLSDDMIELFAAEIGAEIRLVDPGEEQEAELLARYIAGRLADDLQHEHGYRPAVLRVEVEESFGQSATCELRPS